jgi:hypothetical protein
VYKVILPCLGAVFLLAILWVPSGGSIRTRAEIWLSFIGGSLTGWTGMSWHFNPEEKVCYLLFAVVPALGMLSHPLRPSPITAVITTCASCLWLCMGILLTYAGWR